MPTTFTQANPNPVSAANSREGGFTLLELIAVMAVIAVLAGVIGFAFRGAGSQTVGLQAAQAVVSALLTQARSQAAVSGTPVGLFVSMGPPGGFSSSTESILKERYLRCLVVAKREGSSWIAITDRIFLPNDAYVVPLGTGSPRRFPNVLKNGETWFRFNPSGNPTSSMDDVDSSALDDSVDELIPFSADGEESWDFVYFLPQGRTGSGLSGTVALANGLRQPASNDSTPVVLTNPDNVRGVFIGSNGQMRTINDRGGF